ncbi:unnamed protein product [Aphanomyces euteiches]|uniref:Helicase-associated domain-containing protein n=1 Tax=Aphanomyces euteiches TaxID=100861 RepID=A0A6G0W8Y0_9STRA|nr:hypothetical protein Ae201684_017763 [Aphanomyces euteiches]KAH9064747.1 hypothetical protein Ae201684P_003530 [Aphanomyces euteiches]KAH9096807.1 hypothetical protein LEN26_017302 [Aphanomyces euteiches]KAH9150361.1 hypothetical protein AeRB84_006775 [Aphanomyces euteiches]
MPRPKASKASIGFLLNTPLTTTKAGGTYTISLDSQRLFCQVAQLIHAQKAHNRYQIVPCKFKVPHADPWPTRLRGSTLNFTAFRYAYKRQKLHPDVVAAMDAIGFVWDAPQRKWTIQLACLHTYKQIHGDTNVPRAFVVPSQSSEWPEALWGLKVGVMVNDIRKSVATLAADKKAELDALGFVWNAHDVNWAKQLAALTTYRRLYGHTNVPRFFVVPQEQEPWPQDTWGMKLGFVVHNIRTKVSGMAAERKAQLQAVGFQWDGREFMWRYYLLAFHAFKEQFGHLNVDAAFAVPMHNHAWPVEVWAMKLGQVVQDLRAGRLTLSADRQDVLSALGFDWTASSVANETR